MFVAILLTSFFGAGIMPLPAPTFGDGGVSSTVRDSLTYYYSQQDTRAIQRLYRSRARTREEQLLCLYRLYPLTQNAAYIQDIPAESSVGNARELSLIAALWAFRAADGPVTRLPTYGRRSERILNSAIARDAQEPYALLVRGQSLFYKPRMFGGDVREAQRTFEQLRTVLARRSVPGIHPFEAEIWIWMCVRKLNAVRGRTLQQRLLSQRPPPLFRQFLVSPP